MVENPSGPLLNQHNRKQLIFQSYNEYSTLLCSGLFCFTTHNPEFCFLLFSITSFKWFVIKLTGFCVTVYSCFTDMYVCLLIRMEQYPYCLAHVFLNESSEEFIMFTPCSFFHIKAVPKQPSTFK